MNNVKFEVGSDTNPMDMTGTQKRGSVRTTFNHIVSVLAQPSHTDDSAHSDTHTEWQIRFFSPEYDHPIKATIYDYALNNINPRSEAERELPFNIGGDEMEASYLVHTLLG